MRGDRMETRKGRLKYDLPTAYKICGISGWDQACLTSSPSTVATYEEFPVHVLCSEPGGNSIKISIFRKYHVI